MTIIIYIDRKIKRQSGDEETGIIFLGCPAFLAFLAIFVRGQESEQIEGRNCQIVRLDISGYKEISIEIK